MTKIDGLAIDELIEQAKLLKRKWKPPKRHYGVSDKTWQELLDGGDYPKLRFGKL